MTVPTWNDIKHKIGLDKYRHTGDISGTGRVSDSARDERLSLNTQLMTRTPAGLLLKHINGIPILHVEL